MRDLSNVGETRPAVNKFWKPQHPEILIGKLDRVEAGRTYGDRAIFPKCVVLRAADHKPLFTGERHVGITATLEGRITERDSGRYFVLTFTGFGEAVGSNNAPRRFTVTVVSPDRESEIRDLMVRASEALAHDPTPAPLKGDDADDDLPF